MIFKSFHFSIIIYIYISLWCSTASIVTLVFLVSIVKMFVFQILPERYHKQELRSYRCKRHIAWLLEWRRFLLNFLPKTFLFYLLFNCPVFSSFTHTLFIEVLIPSQESEQSCICMTEVSILPLSMFFLLNFGTVSTMFFFFMFLNYNFDYCSLKY